MRVLLVVLGILGGLVGGGSYLAASNAIQQATSLLMVLIAAVLFVGGAVIDAIGKLEAPR